jgi:pilus assembly protein FimV
MAVDKNKVIAEATRLIQKGAYDKAIRAYEKILADDPRDVRVLLKVGELQQKKGDNAAAAATFGRVADAYSEQGFFLKAVAVLKQMMKLAPDDVRVNERLAALYQQLGILSDAMAQLQLVAQTAERAGDAAKLLDVLRRMVELEPDNVVSSVKLGELYAKSSQPRLALELFRRAADTLKRNNRSDEYAKVAERIVALEPGDVALARELAHIHLAKGDTKRALAKLQQCFKADPKDIDTLTLLAQAFKDLGQIAKTVSVYRELAHLHAEHGRAEEVRATWRRVLELAPQDPDATHALAAMRPAAAPARPPAPAPQAPRAPPLRPPSPPRTEPVPAAATAPRLTPPPLAAPAPAAKVGPEAIPKLLTETDVYVKYGLHQKALEHLQKVFSVDPDHLEAREKALQLRSARNDTAGAADEAAAIARIAHARGLGDRARAAVARLRELAPSHPALAALDVDAVPAPADADVIELEPEEVELEVEVPGAAQDDAVALAAASAHGEELVEEDAARAAPAQPVPPAPPPVIAPPPARAAPETLVLGPPPVPGAARARPSAPEPAPAVVAPPPPEPARAAAPRPVAPAELAAPPPPAPASDPQPPAADLAPEPPPPAAPAGAREEEADLADELEEADFFIQQRLFDDAREALSRLLELYPGREEVAARMADLDRLAEGSPPAAPEAPSAPEVPAAPAPGEGFDLARELAEELDAAPSTGGDDASQYSVEDVFSEFKKQVEQTVEAGDADTHYDLGIAYKEMGLLDDAIHEFEVALKGKGRKKELDGLTMIGLCLMEKGDPQGAIEAYRRALRSDLLKPEVARAIHYDLASAYVARGEPEHALHYLQKVLRADPRYRDARAFADRLGGGPGRAPPDVPAAPRGGGPGDGSGTNKIGYA